MGLENNPYDLCMANKIINDKQCTILCHVDYLKISHEEDWVTSDIIANLKEEFVKEEPLTVTKFLVH